MIKNKKKSIIIVISIIALLIGSFILYNILGFADSASNKIAIKSASITSIDTGAGNFDSSDGLTYKEDGYTIESYTAGNDSSKDNRIVRSFDTITYHFDFNIKGKNDNNDYDERKVNIKVTLSDEEAKYIAFDKNGSSGEKNHTFTFDNIYSYGEGFGVDVTLYVLGAKNKSEINPKFEIQESTNTDSNYVVTLGNTGNNHNYSYDSEKTNKYTTTSNFTSYMPTIVSSKTANVNIKLLPQTSEGQKSTYNNLIGRYLTYVFGIEIVGDNENGIKGYTMPEGNITFNINLSQDGNTKNVLTDNNFARLYSPESVSGIEPIVVSMPYSGGNVESSKKTKYPGKVSMSKIDDSTYSVTISDYKLSSSSAGVNADGSNIPNQENIIGTYALTIFSSRSNEDGKNDINTSMSISNIKAVDTSGTNLTINDVSASIVNRYYEEIDYSLVGSFYDLSGSKLSQGGYKFGNNTYDDINGMGSTSRGATLTYRTTFNYKRTLSEQGLKEIIKIDPNAFRVVSIDEKNDIKISVQSPNGSKLSSDDFEVKYISGSFENTNYSGANYRDTLDNRFNSEDIESIKSACNVVNQNLKNYSSDQIQNLYGGPCITANKGVENTFDKISSSKTNDNVEVPITKIIVQTKKGVKLPDNAKVIIEIGIKVRDVSDLTRTYQITSLASSSDYDSKLTYYAPRVTSDENSITNPNNYNKTIYSGSDISKLDVDSNWGDSIKIVNFTSKETISVTNKNNDGSTKINYNANSGETINYNIKTNIVDNSELVGADDVWYINNLKIYVTIPKGLDYMPDKNLGTPEVTTDNDGNTILIYTMSYTKPNQKIKDINFKAIVSPTIKGSAVPLTVSSRVVAININNETDTSYFGSLTDSFTIYATGIQNVIVTQKIGNSGSVVEKNSEFSYLLSGYNNVSSNIKDYTIVDILPSNGDKNGSKFSGTYKVKVTLPNSLGTAKVYCSTQKYSELSNDIFNKNNKFEECNITDEYVSASAIAIKGININVDSYIEDIIVSIKPTDNNYSDKYINLFIGGSETYSKNESNKVETKVINRNISGKVFVDIDEDGIKEESDTYLSDIPVMIYKIDSDNNLTKIQDTTTDKNGYYKFENLNVGRYKIRANYNDSLYDLTLRYALEDTTIDSDAYKIESGVVEISNKRTPDESDGIKVTKEIESVENMDIGLISRKNFGFDISKYITKIDLNYNNTLSTYNYDNQNKVLLSVKNSLRATAKIYYGIKIENNSTKAGYVKLINENIPSGLTFDSNDADNAGWFYQNGELQNISLASDLINPGESRYLTIALNMPRQEQAKTFINTVTLLDIQEYKPETLAQDANIESDLYKIGEAVSYAGINWHVINATDEKSGEQILTLFADSGTIGNKMGHISSNNEVYKWSESLINNYINGDFVNKNMLNLPILYDNSICDDASGLSVASYGGTLLSEGTCQSNIYNLYKVRLLTEKEFETLLSTQSDLEWLTTGSYWLENSSYITPKYDVYGVQTNSVSTKAKAVVNNTSIQDTSANTKLEVRPVIIVSSRNVILE